MSVTFSALAGIQQAESQLDRAANRLVRAFSLPDAQAESPDMPTDTVELSGVMVDLMQAGLGVAANVKAMHAAEDAQRSMLDMLV